MFKLTKDAFPAVVFVNGSALTFSCVPQVTTEKLEAFMKDYAQNRIAMQPISLDEEDREGKLWVAIQIGGLGIAAAACTVLVWMAGTWIKGFIVDKQD
jgi:hypothetical protein